MKCDDLAMARRHLISHAHIKVVAVKDGMVIDSGVGRGIVPLLHMADRLGAGLEGACVADRVIGRAAAFILMTARVAGAYGEILGTEAEQQLQTVGIAVEGGQRVPYILRPDGLGRCLMEQQVVGIDNATEAVDRLRQFLAQLGSAKREGA